MLIKVKCTDVFPRNTVFTHRFHETRQLVSMLSTFVDESDS